MKRKTMLKRLENIKKDISVISEMLDGCVCDNIEAMKILDRAVEEIKEAENILNK